MRLLLKSTVRVRWYMLRIYMSALDRSLSGCRHDARPCEGEPRGKGKMMKFRLKMMHFGLKMMNFGLKMVSFVFNF